MPNDQTAQLLIPTATVYVTLVSLIFALIPTLQQPSRFVVREVRHLRVFTEAFTAWFAVKLIQTHAHLTNLSQLPQLPLSDALEIIVGVLLVGLLWGSKDQFYEIEQAVRKFSNEWPA